MSEIVVFVTVGSEAEGLSLGKALVEKNLVACVNVIPKVQSIFKWEGKIEIQSESLLVLKSTSMRYEELEATIKVLHAYSVPEIIAFPIVLGSEEYLSWVRDMTAHGGGESCGVREPN